MDRNSNLHVDRMDMCSLGCLQASDEKFSDSKIITTFINASLGDFFLLKMLRTGDSSGNEGNSLK